MPLRPPFGAGFLAWGEPEGVELWLDGLRPPPSPDERQRTCDAVFFARERGFQYAVRTAPAATGTVVTEWLFIEDLAARPVQIGIELEAEEFYRLASLCSPVLDRQDRVSFVLSLSGFDDFRTGAEIMKIGNELREAARTVGATSWKAR